MFTAPALCACHRTQAQVPLHANTRVSEAFVQVVLTCLGVSQDVLTRQSPDMHAPVEHACVRRTAECKAANTVFSRSERSAKRCRRSAGSVAGCEEAQALCCGTLARTGQCMQADMHRNAQQHLQNMILTLQRTIQGCSSWDHAPLALRTGGAPVACCSRPRQGRLRHGKIVLRNVCHMLASPVWPRFCKA